jgi:hypothetical protein
VAETKRSISEEEKKNVQTGYANKRYGTIETVNAMHPPLGVDTEHGEWFSTCLLCCVCG